MNITLSAISALLVASQATAKSLTFPSIRGSISDQIEEISTASHTHFVAIDASSTVAISMAVTSDESPSVQQTDRDEEWLAAHNEYRQKWHEMHDKEYAPLKFSTGLKTEAQAWADAMAADGCRLAIDPSTEYGQNIGANRGTGRNAVALRDPQDILAGWENALLKESNNMMTMTQALWYATHYAACADAAGSNCSVFVCRYAKPGNCNMNKSNWEEKTFADDSPCGPQCPPEGCA
mmetsp:Transcript_12400/g.26289  ORF Transcript_12400/g.26289 Transcript_12400/m.26289 type:complete len:236 (-) Transcript_12400:145-852(-)